MTLRTTRKAYLVVLTISDLPPPRITTYFHIDFLNIPLPGSVKKRGELVDVLKATLG